jgi:hypothetical protein
MRGCAVSKVPGLSFRTVGANDFKSFLQSRLHDPAFMSAAPHYGLRYGCVPTTGNFHDLEVVRLL